MSATAWVEDLTAAIRDYSRTRRTAPPVVRVTLASGESRYVLSASAGPNDELISLDVYPQNGASDLLEVERPVEAGEAGSPRGGDFYVTDRMTREVLVVHPLAIQKFELADERRGELRFGFGAGSAASGE